MLDFSAVKEKRTTMNDFASVLSIDNLYTYTNESVDRMQELLDQYSDADIIFVPQDPDANDPTTRNPDDEDLAWTIGHNIVHATASAEEYAVSAAELACGVEFHSRSRSEVPWQLMQTVEHYRQRFKESRRMRLASLDLWPDQPDLSVGYLPWRASGFVNAIGIFTWGLAHDADHIHQFSKILNQIQEQ